MKLSLPHPLSWLAGCLRRTLDEPSDVCLQDIGGGRRIVITRAVTGVSDANGELRVRYIAPEPSGHIHFTLTGTDPNGNPLPTRTFAQDTQIPETLVELPRSGDGFVMHVGTTHPQNNFARPTVVQALESIPVDFRLELLSQGVSPAEVPTIPYTSLSLPQGGLFDYRNNNWRPPHAQHRFGNDADLWILDKTRNVEKIPRRFRRTLERVILEEFFFPVPRESPADEFTNHWHLTRLGEGLITGSFTLKCR